MRQQYDLFMTLPVQKRQQKWIEMMALGWRMASNSIRQQHPEYTEPEFRAALFERLHGSEFPDEQREKIKEWILNQAPNVSADR
jgi:hypothetical protein